MILLDAFTNLSNKLFIFDFFFYGPALFLLWTKFINTTQLSDKIYYSDFPIFGMFSSVSGQPLVMEPLLPLAVMSDSGCTTSAKKKNNNNKENGA